MGDGGLYSIWAGLLALSGLLIGLILWKGREWREADGDGPIDGNYSSRGKIGSATAGPAPSNAGVIANALPKPVEASH